MTNLYENWSLFRLKLEQVKETANGIEARCPSHEDKRASLTATCNGQKILIKCQAGCSFNSIVSVLGMQPCQFFAPKHSGSKLCKKEVARYRYENADGTHAFDVVRFEPKDFRPRRPDGKWTLEGMDRVPYRLPQMLEAVRQSKDVLLVEGEKDCDNAAKIGLTATTLAGGCGKWRDEYLHWFKGATITCCPDNDPPGRKGMAQIAARITIVAEKVVWLELPGLVEKGDLSDWLAIEGNDLTAFRKLLAEQGREWTPELEAELAGEEAPDEPWPDPEEITASLRPVEPLPPELIPEPLRPWLTDIAHRMQCPLDFVTAACVVMLSILTGTRCAIRPKRKDAWQVVPNLWGAIVGLPSALKTPAVQEVTRPLQHLEAEAFKAHEQAQGEHKRDLHKWKLKGEVLEGELKKGYRGGKKAQDPFEVEDQMDTHAEGEPQPPTLRRFSTSDSTVPKLQELMAENPQGLLVLRDELAGFLMSLDREENSGDRAFHLEGWSGQGSFTVDRIGRGTVRTERVCESIFGTIQPARMLPYLRQTVDGSGNDGLTQRFQMSVYPDASTWEYVDDPPDTKAERRAFSLITKLAEMDFPTEAGAVIEEGEPTPHLRFGGEAQSLFVEWLTELETIMLRNPDESPALLEHLGKYRSLMPSLALIFHLVGVADGAASSPVSLKAAKLAVGWCAYLESHARRIYGMAEDITRRAAGVLAEKIRAGRLEDGFTFRDVHRKGWSLLTGKEVVRDALTELVEAGWLRTVEHRPPKEQGGKTKVEYLINPKVKTSLDTPNP